MKDLVEQFKDILVKIAEKEKTDTNSGYTAFFFPLLQDKGFHAPLLLFCVEALERLSLQHLTSAASKMAKNLIASFPNVRKFYNPKVFYDRKDGRLDQEGMHNQISAINHEFDNLRKVLVCLLDHYGEVTLPREKILEADSMDLATRYSNESDSLKIGTRVQARDWPKEEKADEEERTEVPQV